MSLCVPEWDRSGGMLDAVIPSNDFHGPVNGKGDVVRSKRSHFSQLTLAPVPDQDSLDVGWNDNGHLDMQGQSTKGSKSQWQHINYPSGWNSGQETEDGVTPCKPDTPKSGASLETVVNETATEAHPAQHLDGENDEMVSWLTYPLEESLERNYCSDFFGEIPNTHLASLRESFGQATIKTPRAPLLGALWNDAASNRATTADAQMLMGVGRAAGILPQAGVEAFSKVRTLHSAHSLQPSSVTRWQQPHTPNSSNGSSLCGTTNLTSMKASAPASTPTSNPMLPPKTQPVAPVLNVQTLQGNRSGSMNFSHFSRPAAMIKANLHSLAVNGGPPPNARFKQQQNQMGRPMPEACTSTGSSIVDPTTVGQGPSGPHQEVKAQPAAAAEREQSNGINNSRWPAEPTLPPNKDRDSVMSVGDCKSLPTDQETCRLSSVTNGAVLASSEKGASHVTQQPDVQEPTITSASGGYGTSASERPKEVAASTKRKSSERDDTECHSEDGEDESVDTKKPVTGRGSTTKRSRAAEVHNQSERRRRDRINEKMRALQELIPNSNKTDKASMLDEAIEYLKMLQVQLQMMSMRTGMTLPPMVVPSGLQQHMQMPQMAAMPPMGMGMGMVPMGLGMGMMDMAPQGRTVIPMQPHAGPSFNGSMASASSLVDVHGYQQPGVMDYNSYIARPHQPMQMTQALSVDKYNAYILQHQLQQQQHHHQQQQHQHQQHQQQQQHQQHQQHHQHQQQQHQQQQQQQQPHQNHQQAPNMGVGPAH